MDVAGFLATETGGGEEGGDDVSEKGLPGFGVGGYTDDGGGKIAVFFRLEQVTDGAELTEQLARGRQLLGAGADQKLQEVGTVSLGGDAVAPLPIGSGAEGDKRIVIHEWSPFLLCVK